MQFFPLFKLAEENIKSFSPSSLSLISTAWKGVTQHIGCNILVSCVLHRSFVSNFFGNLEQGRKTQYSIFGNLNNEEKKTSVLSFTINRNCNETTTDLQTLPKYQDTNNRGNYGAEMH